MSAITDLALATRATACLGCGKCTGSCPLAVLGTGLSPRALVTRSFAEPAAVLDTDAAFRAMLGDCLTCSACELRCPEGVGINDYVRGLRNLLPDSARPSCPHHQVIHQTARLQALEPANGQPQRPAWLRRDDLRVASRGPVYLFVGCLPVFDAVFAYLDLRTLDIARAAIRLLNRIGIEPVVSGREVCCGHDLLWSGDAEGFRRLAARNAALIRESGATTLVSTCAECTRTFAIDLKEAVPDFKLEVRHLAEFIAARLDKLGLESAAAGEAGAPDATGAGTTAGNGGRRRRRVTYHDPCRLGRQLGVYDAPRQLLDALPGVQRVEMAASGRNATCCGTSGFIHCDIDSRTMQARRLSEARATGARSLVTACPKCLIHFNCTQDETHRRQQLAGARAAAGAPRRAAGSPAGRPAVMEVVDLTVLMANIMAGSPASGRPLAAGAAPSQDRGGTTAVAGESR